MHYIYEHIGLVFGCFSELHVLTRTVLQFSLASLGLSQGTEGGNESFPCL